jgi:lysophospholipid acyltransferase (LPLAT)-like uncharacterized protein
VFSVIGFLGALLLTALGSTFRARYIHRERLESSGAEKKRVIYAFWHEALLPATCLFRNQGIRTLVSQHRDGEYISRTIERMGYTTVRGSTTRGGARALFRLAAAGAAGEDLGVTVDGPRGPARRAQPGVLYIARRSGLPVLPFALACAPARRLSSWDRFMVPLPFSRVVVAFGEPMKVDADEDESGMAHLRDELERRLLEALREAEDALTAWRSKTS